MVSKYKVGDICKNKRGIAVKLVESLKRSRWRVEVTDNNESFTVATSQLSTGEFKTTRCRSVYGVGYLGYGGFVCRDDQGVITPEYVVWSNMIKRCYTKYDSELEQNALYENTKVCDEWHNFQVFAKWYTDNVQKFLDKGEIPKIDKDLLSENFRGTLYSPETCVILPNVINCALIQKRITNTIHNGVYRTNSGMYKAQVMSNYDVVATESFKEPEDAINFYIKTKAKVISDLAEQYKDLISEVAYEKLKNWKPRSISID